ncbi:unnamed protein product [Camellia sinensis]
MASLKASSLMFSSTSSSSCCRREIIRAAIHMPKLHHGGLLSLPNLTKTRGLVEELEMRSGYTNTNTNSSPKYDTKVSDPTVIAKLYAIMEAIVDRVEMHKNIGEQRNNWNSLLLTSINAITLTAATMAGIAATGVGGGAALVSLKLSSTLLYLAATGMLLIMNKIQPSQLTEEQRNASRLFNQLHEEIHTMVCIGNPTTHDVKKAMEKVLALDKAYPLPLLGVMLEKFPKTVEPAVWWPLHQEKRQAKAYSGRKINNRNGWDDKLEEEMREVVRVLKRKDEEDYLRLGEKSLKLNKVLAISGPLLTGLAAIGSAFVGSPSHGSWAVVLGVIGGALSTVVNAFEHGGQVGMVFEMYRSNAGFFKLMEESIESNLEKEEVESRENGEMFEMKVALQLGRSLSELKDLATSSSIKGETMQEIKMIVVLGELGGRDEYSLVEALKQGKISKPVVAWVNGTCARLFKSEVQFGHAGAKSGGEMESAQAKNQALHDAGAVVPTSFEAFETVIKETFEKLLRGAMLLLQRKFKPPQIPEDLNNAIKSGKVRAPTHIISTISDDRAGYGVGDVISLLWFKRSLPRYCTRFIEVLVALTSFEGHSKATMLLIFNNAAQGILSSFVFKYADTILKKYLSTVATIFTAIASAALFGHSDYKLYVRNYSCFHLNTPDEQQNGVVELKDGVVELKDVQDVDEKLLYDTFSAFGVIVTNPKA